MLKLLDTLFHCRHKRCTFPITRKPGEQRSGTTTATGTYYVCLDCGSEFAYDWQAMETVKTKRSETKAATFVEEKVTSRAS